MEGSHDFGFSQQIFLSLRVSASFQHFNSHILYYVAVNIPSHPIRKSQLTWKINGSFLSINLISTSTWWKPRFPKFSTRKLTSNLVYNQREYWLIYLSIDDVPLKTLPKHPSPISRSSSIHSGLMMMNDLNRPFPSQSSVAVDKLEAQYSGLLVSLSWRMTFLDKHTGICVIVITIISSDSCYFITNIQVFSHISFLAWSFFSVFFLNALIILNQLLMFINLW